MKNVSGELAKFICWDKHRCNLKQEDKYPRHCDFKLNQKKLDELNRRYPDLAAANVRIENGARKVVEIRRKINETINC